MEEFALLTLIVFISSSSVIISQKRGEKVTIVRIRYVEEDFHNTNVSSTRFSILLSSSIVSGVSSCQIAYEVYIEFYDFRFGLFFFMKWHVLRCLRV